jgi:hypothetical protein
MAVDLHYSTIHRLLLPSQLSNGLINWLLPFALSRTKSGSRLQSVASSVHIVMAFAAALGLRLAHDGGDAAAIILQSLAKHSLEAAAAAATTAPLEHCYILLEIPLRRPEQGRPRLWRRPRSSPDKISPHLSSSPYHAQSIVASFAAPESAST